MVNFHPRIGLAGAVVKRQALVATPSRPTRPLRKVAAAEAVSNPSPQRVADTLDSSPQNIQPKPNTNLDFDFGNPFGIFGPDDPEPTLTRTRSRLLPLPTRPTDPLTTPVIATDSNGFPLFTGTPTSLTTPETPTSISTPTPTPESTLVTVTQTLPPASTPNSDSASAPPPKGFLQNKSVAGPVIGILSVLAFLILTTVFIFCYRMNRRKKLTREAISFDPTGMMEYNNDTAHLTAAPVRRNSIEKRRYSGYGSSEGAGGTESVYGGATTYGQPSYPSMYSQQPYYPQQQQGYMYGNQAPMGYQGYPAPASVYDPNNRGLPPLPGAVPSRHASPAPPPVPAHDTRDAHPDNRGTLRESAAYDGLAVEGQTLKIVNE